MRKEPSPEARIAVAIRHAATARGITLAPNDLRALAAAARAAANYKPPAPCNRLDKVTPRQLEVLASLAAGRTLAQTATAQGRSLATIRSLAFRAYRRLGASNGTHAVVIAMRAGLLDEPTA